MNWIFPSSFPFFLSCLLHLVVTNSLRFLCSILLIIFFDGSGKRFFGSCPLGPQNGTNQEIQFAEFLMTQSGKVSLDTYTQNIKEKRKWGDGGRGGKAEDKSD